jgi:O-antigen/teichoic acid export membrane protein
VFHANLAKKYINFGIKGYLANLMAFLNYRLDMFLVAYFLTPMDVGYYSLAVGLAELLWYIPNSVSTILFPRVSSSDKKQANKFTPVISRHTLFVVSLIALGLLIFGRLMIKVVYGAEYLPSVKPLLILLPGIVALSLSKVCSSYILGRGRPIIAAYTSLVVVGVNISLNLLLIPKWGIAGAAFASTVSYSVGTCIKLIVFLKMSENSLLNTLIIKKQDIETYILPNLKRLKNAITRV